MAITDFLLSCDWGTSSFRLRLLRLPDLQILASQTSSNGIASTYDAWQRAGLGKEERLRFYQAFLRSQIVALEEQAGVLLRDVPLVISGMASSSIGMLELPYKSLPFLADGSDLLVERLEPADDFPHRVFLVSGVCSTEDVMRGEEIQIAGCRPLKSSGEQLFILPGTHSKHIWLKEGRVERFATYMTGELFDLLATRSILSKAVKKSALSDDPLNQESFREGLRAGASSNILNALFRVRTNQLFERWPETANLHYLSGLLIGQELSGLKNDSCERLVLLANATLGPLYLDALNTLELSFPVTLQNIDTAILQGHAQVYRNAFQSPD